MDYLTTHTSLSPIRPGFAPSFVNYKEVCTQFAAASDKVYQLLARGRWFCLGTLASSTTKPGGHDIAEILLKVALNTKKIKFKILFCEGYLKGVYNISYNSCSFDAVLSLKYIHVYAYGHPLTLRVSNYKI